MHHKCTIQREPARALQSAKQTPTQPFHNLWIFSDIQITEEQSIILRNPGSDFSWRVIIYEMTANVCNQTLSRGGINRLEEAATAVQIETPQIFGPL